MGESAPAIYITPVGTVLAYAGQLSNDALNRLGWQICDGSRFGTDKNPDLFAAIGTANGGDGKTFFNVPDYRGYFLRGVDSSGTVDPDAGDRPAPRYGAASGPHAGSVQGWATGSPKTDFVVKLPNLPNQQLHVSPGAGVDFMSVPYGPTVNQTNAGGDAETRPPNAYVRFIIQIVNDARLPIGTVSPFAGNTPYAGAALGYWRLCDGTNYPQNYLTTLYAAIGKTHGGDEMFFKVPDYRGRFLRGAADGTDRDPDRAARIPMAPGGVGQDNVGSIQAYATGEPVSHFDIGFSICTTKITAPSRGSYPGARWNPNGRSIQVTGSGGGDKESRPTNINVDYYILYTPDVGSSVDIFPVGGVIGIPSDKPPSGNWLLCDGTQHLTREYPELFAAIRYDNGGGFDAFALPNYQGQFLRGTNRGATTYPGGTGTSLPTDTRDPDAANRTAAFIGGQTEDNVGSAQPWATARPRKQDISATILCLPSSAANVDQASTSNNLAWWFDDYGPAALFNGDNETRPLNANIRFYIRCASY
jgi:microcystin-dependent protein